MPRVSVVVTTYNRAGLLKETLSSILSQTFTNFELIIVDNMSTDGTGAYVVSIDDGRIRYFKNPNNGVIAVNRNFGISRARGVYIAFCDDDDLWEPDKLKAQTAFMEANPEVILSFGYARDFYDSDGGRLDGTLKFSKAECDSKNSFESLLSGNAVATLTVMVRKAGLEDAGIFDEDPALMTVEDYDLWLRMARGGAIACIPRLLGRYRLHSLSASGNEASQKKRLLAIVEKFKDNGWLDAILAKKFEAHVCWMIGNAALGARDSGYRQWYRKAFGLDISAKTLLGAFFCLLPFFMANAAYRLLKWFKSRRLA
ncbi:MAG: glycosyltransferase [Deltaproteobacteria bacterium]|nr:glycosyltransferase [Deltaproteobacteria bacterium]